MSITSQSNNNSFTLTKTKNSRSGVIFGNIMNKADSIDYIIKKLQKMKGTRSSIENEIINDYLSKNFTYFRQLKESNEHEKLSKLICVLNLETFNPGKNIIRFGEEGDKFYIVLKGTVAIYKPKYVQRTMKTSDFLIYINEWYHEEDDHLAYERVIEKNASLNLDWETLQELPSESYLLRKRLNFLIEEMELLSSFGSGFAFGEIALLNRCTRNATIRAVTKSHLVSIDKADYNKMIREIEKKHLEKKIKTFQTGYPLFKSWTLYQIIRLFNCFSKQTLISGEYWFKQNEESDYIYIISSGVYEVYSLVSYGWLGDYFKYIISAKNNLVHWLDIENRRLKESELHKLYDDTLEWKEESPCQYNPLKINKATLSKEFVINFANIKKEEEEINDPFNWFKVFIKTIKDNDILGIEDCWELKNRFSFVKCVSAFGEVQKVSRFDFLRLLNINPDKNSNNKIMEVIAKKKTLLYKQILGNARARENRLTCWWDYKYDQLIESSDSRMELKWRDKHSFEYDTFNLPHSYKQEENKRKIFQPRPQVQTWRAHILSNQYKQLSNVKVSTLKNKSEKRFKKTTQSMWTKVPLQTMICNNNNNKENKEIIHNNSDNRYWSPPSYNQTESNSIPKNTKISLRKAPKNALSLISHRIASKSKMMSSPNITESNLRMFSKMKTSFNSNSNLNAYLLNYKSNDKVNTRYNSSDNTNTKFNNSISNNISDKENTNNIKTILYKKEIKDLISGKNETEKENLASRNEVNLRNCCLKETLVKDF